MIELIIIPGCKVKNEQTKDDIKTEPKLYLDIYLEISIFITIIKKVKIIIIKLKIKLANYDV